MNVDSAIVVALGGNLGGPAAVIQRFSDSIQSLSESWGTPLVSGIYHTAPIGVQSQPDFVNAVAAWWPEELPEPEQALALLQRLEDAHGRERMVPGGARTLDLDLLLHAGQSRDVPGLRVPHPRMASRAFVLVPLQELFGSEFRWTRQELSVGELLALPKIAVQRCERVGDEAQILRFSVDNFGTSSKS